MIENFFRREFPDKKEKNYSDNEIRFYLEIVAINKIKPLYSERKEFRVKRKLDKNDKNHL